MDILHRFESGYVCGYIYIHIYIYMHAICTSICMHICMYIYKYVYIHDSTIPHECIKLMSVTVSFTLENVHPENVLQFM